MRSRAGRARRAGSAGSSGTTSSLNGEQTSVRDVGGGTQFESVVSTGSGISGNSPGVRESRGIDVGGNDTDLLKSSGRTLGQDDLRDGGDGGVNPIPFIKYTLIHSDLCN